MLEYVKLWVYTMLLVTGVVTVHAGFITEPGVRKWEYTIVAALALLAYTIAMRYDRRS